jgi:hypothetical protein
VSLASIFDMTRINHFTLDINYVQDLKQTPNDDKPCDSFCEAYYGPSLIGKTNLYIYLSF